MSAPVPVGWPTAAQRAERLYNQAQLDLWRLGHRHLTWWPKADGTGAHESWCAWCGEYATVEPGAIGRAEARGVTLNQRCEDLQRWASQKAAAKR